MLGSDGKFLGRIIIDYSLQSNQFDLRDAIYTLVIKIAEKATETKAPKRIVQ